MPYLAKDLQDCKIDDASNSVAVAPPPTEEVEELNSSDNGTGNGNRNNDKADEEDSDYLNDDANDADNSAAADYVLAVPPPNIPEKDNNNSTTAVAVDVYDENETLASLAQTLAKEKVLGFDNDYDGNDYYGETALCDASSPGDEKDERRIEEGLYYAVRVGYAVGSPLLVEDEDDNGMFHPHKRRKRDGLSSSAYTVRVPSKTCYYSTAPIVKINSAIFLYWEDVRQFVDIITSSSNTNNENYKTVYDVFHTLEEAQDYLKSARPLRETTARENNVLTAAQESLAEAGQPASIPNRTQTSESSNAVGVVNKKDGLNVVGVDGGSVVIPSLPPLRHVNQSMSDEDSTDQSKSNGGSNSNNSQEGNEGNPAPKKSKKKYYSKKGDSWNMMYKRLAEYKEANEGSIEIPDMPEGEKTNPDTKKLESLQRWCTAQVSRQRRYSQGCQHQDESSLDACQMTEERIEKLREIGFPLVPSYDEMFEKLAAHKAETGILEVEEEDDKELFAWTKEQKKMLSQHFEGHPVSLSDDQIQNLKSLGFEKGGRGKGGPVVFDVGSEEKKWDSMLEVLIEYKEEHGSFALPVHDPSMPKPMKKLKFWVRTQRMEFKKLKQGTTSSLTARRLQLLNATGIDLAPKVENISWEARMQSLREFSSEHGHCKPGRTHPLWNFVISLRQLYLKREKGESNSMTEERVNDLVEIGFVFKAGKTPNVRVTVQKTWEERFQDLLAFKEEHGHTAVPRRVGPLGNWVKSLRDGYRNMRAGKKTYMMTAERALRLTEIGFNFQPMQLKGGTDRDEVE